MNKTSIEWCDYSINPIRFLPHGSERTVTMCQKVSPGCKGCYAEGITRRFWPKEALTKFPGYTAAGILSGDFVLDEAKLLQVLKYKKPCRLFWGDMTDLFLESIPWEFLNKCFAICALTPHITHMFLTKRPEVMRQFVEAIGNGAKNDDWFLQEAADEFIDNCAVLEDHLWPLPNVWLGTSTENQAAVDERILHLLQTPASVRFISAEPLLGPVDLTRWMRISWQCSGCREYFSGPLQKKCPTCGREHYWTGSHAFNPKGGQTGSGLDWVIVGAESGPGARPMDVRWAQSIVRQCREASVACFVKQMGAVSIIPACRQNHFEWGEGKFEHFEFGKHAQEMWRIKLNDRKGGDWSEWPEYLRIRQFPEVQR